MKASATLMVLSSWMAFAGPAEAQAQARFSVIERSDDSFGASAPVPNGT